MRRTIAYAVLAIALTTASTSVGAQMLVSVDLGVSAYPLTYSGAESLAAATDPLFSGASVWNGLGLAADYLDTPVASASFSNLLDSSGLLTGISFSATGAIKSFNYANFYGASWPGALFGDYWFFNSRDASDTIDWALSGLEPGAEYRMVFYGSAQDYDRVFNLLLDTDGDGSLLDEASLPLVSLLNSFPSPLYMSSVIASPSGQIIGRGIGVPRASEDYLRDEANWSGFQIIQVPAATVPEPATLVLLSIGLAGMGAMMRKTFVVLEWRKT